MKSLIRNILLPLINLVIIALCATILYQDYSSSVRPVKTEQIGTITFKRKVAERKYSEQVIWEKLANNAPIYNFDAIRTDKDSLAVINLDDGTAIELEEETMVILQGSNKGLDINFEQGSISAKTANADSRLNIKSGETTVALSSGDVNLNKSKEELNINVNSGTANIQAGGQTTALDSTKTAKIAAGAATVEDVKIRLTSPSPNKNILAAGSSAVSFSWETSSNKESLFEISSRADFSQVVTTRKTKGRSATVSLSEGIYYWRVSSEGQFSQVRRVAVISEGIPVMLRPFNSQQFQYRDRRPLVTFTWNGAESANVYVVDIARDYEMANIVKTLRAYNPLISTDSLENGTYYCRVRAQYNLPEGRRELASSVRTFSISKSSDINPPVLLSPHRNKKILATVVNTVFNWKLVDEATSYSLSIYRASNSQNILNTSVATNFFTLSSKLEPGAYKWRVVAVAEDGTKSKPSSEGAFEVTTSGEIKTLAPSDGRKFDQAGTLRFTWSDTGSGNRYLIQISKDPLFVTTYKEREVTGRQASFSEIAGGTYYWKVYQLNESGRRLIASNTATFSVSGKVTNPFLIAPKNKKYPFNTASVSFSWRRVPNASYYELEIYKQAFPQAELVTKKVVQTNNYSHNISQLKPGKYLWKVRAVQRSGGRILSKSGFAEDYFSKDIKIVEKLPKPKIKTPSTIFVE